jgi:hypothetical protein
MSEEKTIEAGNSLPPPLGSAIVADGYTDLSALAISRCVDLYRSMSFRDASSRSREIFRAWALGEEIVRIKLTNTSREAR